MKIKLTLCIHNIVSIAFISLFIYSSAGCGFHLRGSSELKNKLQALSIQSGITNSAIIAELERRLQTLNIKRNKSAENTLIVSNIKSEKRAIAYDNRGKVARYELTKSLSIHLIQNGKVLLQPTNISTRQPYHYNESDTSAKEEEQALLEREMNSTMVSHIIRHLEKLPFTRPTQ